MFFNAHSILLYCSPVQSTHANKNTPQHKQTNDDRFYFHRVEYGQTERVIKTTL